MWRTGGGGVEELLVLSGVNLGVVEVGTCFGVLVFLLW